MPLKSLGADSAASSRELAGEPSMLPAGEQQLHNQVQHSVHELEPLTRYAVRVIAVNLVGRSRPSVALSLRTEEEGEWLVSRGSHGSF